MPLAAIIALVLCVYAVMGLFGLVATRWMRHGGLKEVAEAEPQAAGFLISYGDGLRGAVWIAAIISYGFSAIFAVAGFSDAVWLLAAALTLDIALFLSWSQRHLYLAHLTAAQRAGEVATVLTLAACLAGLLALRDAGVLR